MLIFRLNRRASREEKRPVYLNVAGKNWCLNREVRHIKKICGRISSARLARELYFEEMRDMRNRWRKFCYVSTQRQDA